MLYLLIVGVMIFVIAAIIFYFRFAYSAMLDDIEHFNLQENNQSLVTAKLEIDL